MGVPVSALTAIFQAASRVITTVNYSSSQFMKGVSGPYSTTFAAGKVSMTATTCAWVGWITGTTATWLAYQYVSSQPAGMVKVSVDGGSFADAVVSGGRYTLFSGLSNTQHFVVIRINGAYGTLANFPATGNVLTVTGVSPSMVTASTNFSYFDENPLVDFAGLSAANVSGFFPTKIRSTSGTTYGSNVATIRFRGNPTWIIANVGTTCNRVYLSKNQAPPTKVVVSNVNGVAYISGLDGSLADYSIWLGGTAGSYAQQGSAYCTDATIIEDVTTKRMMLELGDSITFGASATSVGEVAILQTAAALGYSGCTSGISGNTMAQLDARVSSVLAALHRSPTTSDVVSLQIGTNGVFDSGWESVYSSIVNKVLTAGFGKVICWMLPRPTDTLYDAAIENIKNLVTTLGDSRVKFLETRSVDYKAIQRPDGVHPNDAGYAALTLLQQRDFPALLA